MFLIALRHLFKCFQCKLSEIKGEIKQKILGTSRVFDLFSNKCAKYKFRTFLVFLMQEASKIKDLDTIPLVRIGDFYWTPKFHIS